MLKKSVLFLVVSAVALSLAAKELPFGKFSVDEKTGILRIDSVTVYGCWAPKGGWAGSVVQKNQTFTMDEEFPKSGKKTFSVSGVWNLGEGGKFDLAETISNKGAGQFNVQYKVTADTAVPTHFIGVEMRLPATAFLGKSIVIDGKTVQLTAPEEKTRTLFTESNDVNRHTISFNDGAYRISVAAKTRVEVISVRKLPKDAHDFYVLRLSLKPWRGDLSEAELNMAFTFVKESKPEAEEDL